MDDSAPSPPGRRWYSPLELLKRLVLYLVIAYAVLCGYLYFMQNSLLYPREELSAGQASRQAAAFGLIPWNHVGSGGGSAPQGYIRPDFTRPTLRGTIVLFHGSGGGSAPQGYIRPDFTRPTLRGTIVLFHGNGGAAYERTAYVDAFTRRGFRTFLYEYPGYGGRPGIPSEAAIVPDARALIRDFDRVGYGPLYVWGESLGAGVAASVCADPNVRVQGLALVTPWDTLVHVAQSHYPWFPVRLLLVDRYDSIANLRHFGRPICVIRSSEDEIIPSACSINLYNQLPEPKKVIVQDGYGHNDWPRSPELAWWDDALNFIAPKK